MKLPITTWTGGQPDSTDYIFAKECSDVAGSEHFFELIGPEKMTAWLYPMVLFQGGIFATLHSHPCQNFDFPLPFNAYIQGVGPRYIKPWNIRPFHLKIDKKNEVAAALKSYILRNDIEKSGFKNIWREKYKTICSHAIDNHLNILLGPYEINDKIITFFDYFALHQMVRKFLNKANMIARNVRKNYLPYLDHELISALAGIPIQERVANRIQADLIKRLYPKLLNVPLAKTMLPIPASTHQGWIGRKFTRIKRRIKNRFGTRLKQRFVPNHYLFEWSQHEMREGLDKILFNPKAAFREYMDWGTIEPMLKQHFSGKHNWETVLGALVVFEISHRLWVDSHTYEL